MSAAATAWAWEQQTRSSGQRLVLLALCEHMADHDDITGVTAWPSVSRLAAMTALSDSSVRAHLDDLVDAGLVAKVERRRRRNGTMGTWLYRAQMDVHTPVHNQGTTAGPPAVPTAGPPAVGHRRPTGAHELSIQKPPHKIAEGCARCDGTGWEYLEAANQVAECDHEPFAPPQLELIVP